MRPEWCQEHARHAAARQQQPLVGLISACSHLDQARAILPGHAHEPPRDGNPHDGLEKVGTGTVSTSDRFGLCSCQAATESRPPTARAPGDQQRRVQHSLGGVQDEGQQHTGQDCGEVRTGTIGASFQMEGNRSPYSAAPGPCPERSIWAPTLRCGWTIVKYPEKCD